MTAAAIELVFWMFLLGLNAGSMLNLALVRYSNKRSLLHQASQCNRCGHWLSWWENIPLFGYLLLGGRCRYCGEAISPRYPFVEIAAGALFALPAAWYPMSPGFAIAGALASAWLLLMYMVDVRYSAGTPWKSALILLTALSAAPLNPLLGAGAMERIFSALAAGCVCAASLTVLALVRAILARGRSPRNDVLLLAAIAAVLGAPGALFSVSFALTLALFPGLRESLLRRRRSRVEKPHMRSNAFPDGAQYRAAAASPRPYAPSDFQSDG